MFYLNKMSLTREKNSASSRSLASKLFSKEYGLQYIELTDVHVRIFLCSYSDSS